MSGNGITRMGPGAGGYSCALTKTRANLVALGAISTKTYTFGPFPAGCYLLGGYLEIPAGFDVGQSPEITIGTTSYPVCCADVGLDAAKAPTSFNYIADLGGLNPSVYVGGESVLVTVLVGSGNFTTLTTGSFNVVVLVSAPLQSVTAS